MGKLNYTHRKIGGEKLGNAVKKDVLKHNPQPNGSKARAHRDPHLDVYLQGRELGDVGLRIACDGFVQALSSGSIRLDELHLAENGITMRGLKALCEVIRLASNDIKDLDLRANNLAVVTQEDVDDWEQFLRAFREVSCLRRLDISENPIGDKGYETFLRMYSRESPIYLPKPPKSDSSDAGYDTDELDDDSDGSVTFHAKARRLSGTGRDSATSTAQTTPIKGEAMSSPSSKHLTLRPSPGMMRESENVELQGLRSIPYLILSDTGVTDSGALFLSYILPLHYTPQRLMPYFPPPKAGTQTETLEAYYATSCRGVVYRPNEQLNSLLSTRMLDLAEGMREGYSIKIVRPEVNPFKYSPKKAKDLNFALGEICIPPLVRDLERARHKIQGSILNVNGPHYISLWSAALKMLALSRLVFSDKDAEPYRVPKQSPHRRSLPSAASCSYINGSGSKKVYSPTHGLGRKVSSGSLRDEDPGSPSVDGRSLAQALASLATSPGCPQRARKSSIPLAEHLTEVQDSEGSVSSDPPATEATDASTHEEQGVDETQKSKRTNEGVKTNGGADVKQKLPGGLPESIWFTIVAMSADPEGLLSDNQMWNMIKWAKARNTLEMERELSGKLKSAQIWRILENTGCLAYEGL